MTTIKGSPITVAEAAKILGVSSIRVRQLCQAGKIGRKFGVLWMLTDREVQRFKPFHRHKRGPEKKSRNSS